MKDTDDMDFRSVVVFGPQGCGKTRNAEALAAHFGLRFVVDDWDPKHHCLVRGALHLSHAPSKSDTARSFDFDTIAFDPDKRGRVTFLHPESLHQAKLWGRPSFIMPEGHRKVYQDD